MENVLTSYSYWNNLALNIAIISITLGPSSIVGYVIWLLYIRDSKRKYDTIIKYEVGVLWFASLTILVGCSFLANANIDELNALWVFVRIFTTFSMFLIVALSVQNLLKFYYPFYVEKRLKYLRHKPRISPKTGKPMKLLSEEEEDVYLDEGMQAEENLFSTDYDVWKDEETGYIKIEKYSGHMLALKCPECNYQTFKVMREEIVKSPENNHPGELTKHYKCAYCGFKAAETVKVLESFKLEESLLDKKE